MRISDWSSDVCSSDLPCTSRRAGTGSGLSNRPNAAERRSATAVGSRPAGFRPAHAPQWREAHASEVSPGDAVAAERSEPDKGRREGAPLGIQFAEIRRQLDFQLLALDHVRGQVAEAAGARKSVV